MFLGKIKLIELDELTSELKFTRILKELIKEVVTFDIVANELKIYENKGLISDVQDIEWFNFWLQEVFPEQIMSEIKQEVSSNTYNPRPGASNFRTVWHKINKILITKQRELFNDKFLNYSFNRRDLAIIGHLLI